MTITVLLLVAAVLLVGVAVAATLVMLRATLRARNQMALDRDAAARDAQTAKDAAHEVSKKAAQVEGLVPGQKSPEIVPQKPFLVEVQKIDGLFFVPEGLHSPIAVYNLTAVFTLVQPCIVAISVRALLTKAESDAAIGVRVDGRDHFFVFNRFLTLGGKGIAEARLMPGPHTVEVVLKGCTLDASTEAPAILTVYVPGQNDGFETPEKWFNTILQKVGSTKLVPPPLPRSVMIIPAFTVRCSCVSGGNGYPVSSSPLTNTSRSPFGNYQPATSSPGVCSRCGGRGWVAIEKG